MSSATDNGVADASVATGEEEIVYVPPVSSNSSSGVDVVIPVAADDVAAVAESVAPQQKGSSVRSTGKASKAVNAGANEQQQKINRRKRGKGFRLTTRKARSAGGSKRKRDDTNGPAGELDDDMVAPSAKRQLSQTSALLKYENRLNQLAPETFAVLHNKWISLYDKEIRHKHLAEGSFPIAWTSVLQRVAAKHGVVIKGVLPHYHRNDPPIYEVRPDIVEESKKDVYKGEIIAARVYIPPSGVAHAADPLSVFAFSVKDRRNDKDWQDLAKSIKQQQQQQQNDVAVSASVPSVEPIAAAVADVVA